MSRHTSLQREMEVPRRAPQAISGTPDSYSFDNGTFQFSYSTEEADGLGSFPAGSQTTISVPSVEFPDGYQVSVTEERSSQPPTPPNWSSRQTPAQAPSPSR